MTFIFQHFLSYFYFYIFPLPPRQNAHQLPLETNSWLKRETQQLLGCEKFKTFFNLNFDYSDQT